MTALAAPPMMVEAVPAADYSFRPGRIHNLHADSYITRYITSHGDVTGRQVAYALLRAMEASR